MSNGHGTKVRKRNGSVEPLNLEKIHKMTAEACDGLGGGVSASQVEMNSGIQFYDGITTAEIQEILVRSASDLIHWTHQTISLLLLDCSCLDLESRCLDLSGSMDTHPFLSIVTSV